MTPEQVRQDALATIQEWLPGYTFPVEGPQDKISCVSVNAFDSTLVMQYEILDRSGNHEQFLINVEVQKL